MGYTHYWYINPEGDEKKFMKAKREMVKILRKESKLIAGWDGKGRPQLMKAIPKRGIKVTVGEPDYSISFNGRGDFSHETFMLPSMLADLVDKKKNPWGVQKDDDGFVFNFCKTACKPYDIIVTACLVVLKHYMGPDVKVMSDGDLEGMRQGMWLAGEILDMEFSNPVAATEIPEGL